jgi:virginiamycin B lyase
MMRKEFISAGALVLVLAGCSARHALPTPGGGSAAKPLVVQTGKVPVNWTQFVWGDTLNNPVGGVSIVTGPDKNLWYTDYSSAALIRMTMSGSTHAYALKYNGTSPFNPYAITVGANGKFYITNANVAFLGVATTGGVFSTIAIPSGDQAQDSATLGPDGNVWFVEYSHVGKITPAGVITEYPYPDNPGNSSGAITTGPDDHIWVTENSIIDDVDPATGEMIQYPLGCQSYGLVAASDGNLYVNCQSSLVRVTTGGSVTSIPIPFYAYTSPPALAVGPDGNPWYVVSGSNQIAVYNTTANTLKVYFPPNGYSTDYALTASVDGNMWAMDSTGFIDVYIINVLSVSPKTVSLTGAGKTATLTVTEKGTSAWTAKSSNVAVATVKQGTSPNLFTVTSVAHGSATVTVSDAVFNSFAVKVTVH